MEGERKRQELSRDRLTYSTLPAQHQTAETQLVTSRKEQTRVKRRVHVELTFIMLPETQLYFTHFPLSARCLNVQ